MSSEIYETFSEDPGIYRDALRSGLNQEYSDRQVDRYLLQASTNTHTETDQKNSRETFEHTTPHMAHAAEATLSKHEKAPNKIHILRDDDRGVYGMFSGMSGRQPTGGFAMQGDIASRSAAEAARSYVFADVLDTHDADDNLNFVQNSLEEANMSIGQLKDQNPGLGRMSTEGVVFRRFRDHGGQENIAYAGVGDVQLARIREGNLEYIPSEESASVSGFPSSSIDGRHGFQGVSYSGITDVRPGDRLVLLSPEFNDPARLDEYRSMLDPGLNPDPETAVDALIDYGPESVDKGLMVLDVRDNAGSESGQVHPGTANESGSHPDPDIDEPERAEGFWSDDEVNHEEWNPDTREDDEHAVVKPDEAPEDELSPEERKLRAYEWDADEFIARHNYKDLLLNDADILWYRYRLAKTRNKAGRGGLLPYVRRRRFGLKNATRAYEVSRYRLMERRVAESGIQDPDHRAALRARLEALEDSILHDKEVDVYMNKTYDSWYAAVLEQYHRGTRVALGIGSVAVGSVVGITGAAMGMPGSAVAGGGVAGASFGFGHEFLKTEREIDRYGSGGKTFSDEEQASVREAARDEVLGGLTDEKWHEYLREYLARRSNNEHVDASAMAEKLVQNIMDESSRRGEQLLRHEAAVDAELKRYAAKKAMQRAIPWAAGGLAIGAMLEYVASTVEPFGADGDGAAGPESPSPADTPPPGEASPYAGGTPGGEPAPEPPAPEGQPGADAPENGANVWQRLGLPEGYINKAPGGYSIEARSGSATNSIWAAAKHALHDFTGGEPNVYQVDALKDQLVEQFAASGRDARLQPGERFFIRNEQIQRAIDIARQYTG